MKYIFYIVHTAQICMPNYLHLTPHAHFIPKPGLMELQTIHLRVTLEIKM